MREKLQALNFANELFKTLIARFNLARKWRKSGNIAKIYPFQVGSDPSTRLVRENEWAFQKNTRDLTVDDIRHPGGIDISIDDIKRANLIH